MKKIEFTVVTLLAFGFPSSAAQAQHAHPASKNVAPEIGAPAMPFQLKTLDGKSISLTSYRGTPLMINFFASWCDPCREEMPLINELAAQSESDGYRVLAIAVEDSRAAVTQYAKESKLVFPIALDLNSTVKRAYRIFGPPATFLWIAKASSETSSSVHSRRNGRRLRSPMPLYEDDSR